MKNDDAKIKNNEKQDGKEEIDSDQKDEQTVPEDSKIEELKKKVEDFENKYKRALADYQNLAKRTQEERIDWIKTANRELVLRILPILDTLLLASIHSQDKTLQVTIQQFLDVLKQEGIQKIETIGKEFNPHLMEAIGTQDGEEGKVLEETRAGYIMIDKVLRPAQVIVGKKS